MTAPTSLNLELLIKLLKMTTSPNDAEALLAARKANEQLGKVAGDWETLLRGKVTLIADPFSGPAANVPPSQHRAPPPAPSRPVPRAAPSPQQPYTAPPRQAPPRQAPQPQPQAAASSSYYKRVHPRTTTAKRKTQGKKLPQPTASDLA